MIGGETENIVLAVNDSPDQLELIRELLRQPGYKVVTADNGHEGVESAYKYSPDLIISDVSMPVMDGIELCRTIRQNPKLRTIPILLVSAVHKDSESIVEGLRIGADDYLEVPYDPMQLVAKVSRLLERKKTEEALQRREEYFRSLTENSSDNITVLDSGGITIYENPSVERMIGYRPEELIGRNNFDLVHPEDRDHVIYKFKKGMQRDTILPPYQYRHKHKNGTWRVLESIGKRFVDEKGRLLAIINTRDITERKEAERRIEESEQRYRSLFDHNPDAVFSLDLYDRLLNANQVATRLTGYRAEELIGRLFEELFAADDREHVASHTRAALKGQPQNFEATIIAQDSRRVAASVLNVPIVVNGNVIGLYSVVRDVTEQRAANEKLKKSEEQLLQAQKMEAIGQLAGGVAHDFNNLLTAISGYSDLSLKRLTANDPLRHYVGEISKACARAASLTAQLLAFSRQQLLQLQVLKLNTIIADMAEMLARLIGENIELRVLLDHRLGSIKADAGQIEQVILNLAVNARDAMPEGGKLTIETNNVYLDQDYIGSRMEVTPGYYVRLSVSDTGCGMDEKIRKQIFEPFFTTKGVGKGTGLGLSTVYGIVKQSGGNISVYSEPKRGTTFNIYLPRVDEEIQESHRKVEVPDVPGGTETILLAEDDEAIRNLIREVLETSGYRVLEAANGLAALQLCEQYEEPIHLLLTDVVMPEMSGRILAERLSAIRPNLRVLYMSGYTTDTVVLHGVLSEGTSFIQKPFTPATLVNKVREVLSAAES